MNKVLLLFLCTVISVSALGCASGSNFRAKGVDFSSLTYAIMPFDGNDKGLGVATADKLSIKFLKNDYSIVERDKLDSLLKEKELHLSMEINNLDDETKESFNYLGVSAMIYGSVTTFPPSTVSVYGIPVTSYRSMISVKIIDVNSGQIIYIFDGEYSSTSSYSKCIDKGIKKFIKELERAS